MIVKKILPSKQFIILCLHLQLQKFCFINKALIKSLLNISIFYLNKYLNSEDSYKMYIFSSIALKTCDCIWNASHASHKKSVRYKHLYYTRMLLEPNLWSLVMHDWQKLLFRHMTDVAIQSVKANCNIYNHLNKLSQFKCCTSTAFGVYTHCNISTG